MDEEFGVVVAFDAFEHRDEFVDAVEDRGTRADDWEESFNAEEVPGVDVAVEDEGEEVFLAGGWVGLERYFAR